MHKCCGVGGNAWTASSSDFGQYLIVDLGQVMNVTLIATQGRSSQNEYVKEYRIGYGTNGLDYQDYKEEDGNTKVSLILVGACLLTIFILFSILMVEH